MYIETESTPNPATVKFLPGRDVLPGRSVDFTTADEARGSPLATRLLEVDGVRGVYLGSDFISVTKADPIDWFALKPVVLGAIMEHYLSGEPVVLEEAEGADAPAFDAADPTVRQIVDLIDTRVRPAVARDGGDIVFKGFERGVVYLTMRGACSGCPSSALTLKSGIENLLRFYVPDVVEVRAVD